jgi:hybrid polyketide synthase/nonribosomal peptide synthetase FtdB
VSLNKSRVNTLKKYPLAIVGIGCRFPGAANSPQAFWRLLCEKTDAIIPVPKSRWNIKKYYSRDVNKPGKSYVKEGGFIQQNIEEFDPAFFNISPREATRIDPQQRILLETAWEAIEDSGMHLSSFQQRRTGVFIGGFCLDSKLIQLDPLNNKTIDSFTSAGITMTILSNRISHVFDLKGPSITVDTACSSSLVATNLACQSIWQGDSDMVLVGGVNMMLHPEYFVSMCKGRFLSPSARCHAFDSRADGYVRSEGAGIIILKPLHQALADEDRIYAVIENSGVNQDGHTPGIFLPNPNAQEQLIRSVYEYAGVDLNDIVYVEAHGTGTQQGDVAEISALQKVFQSKNEKCLLGSVKTNIGHLEAASGIAGLIKTSLCLYHGAVPPNLHFENANQNLDFDVLNFKIPTEIETLSAEREVLYAGLNSFGYGGTNCHVLMRSVHRENKKVLKKTGEVHWPVILPLTAREPQAVHTLAAEHLQWIEEQKSFSDADVANMMYTLAEKRTNHPCRAAIFSENIAALKTSLAKLAANTVSPEISYHETSSMPKKLVFVYTGMGPQWWGMGQQLIKESPVFDAFLTECDTYFTAYADWSLRAECLKSEADSLMAKTEVAQPMNFVVQAGISKILSHFGIEPDMVIGHSVGEITAAYIAGSLNLEHALLLSYHRSRLQATCAGMGGMLAVNLSEADAKELIEGTEVAIAAVNSSTSLTLAGDKRQLESIAEILTSRELFNRFLKVEVPYHSSAMDPIREALLAALEELQPRKAIIPMYSTVTGALIEGEILDANYWWNNVRQPVLFRQGIDACLSMDAYNIMVEIGPHPVTKNYLSERLMQSNTMGKYFHSLYRGEAETARIYQLLGELFTVGYDVVWRNMFSHGCFIDLPKYPWQRHPCWIKNDNTRKYRQIESNYLFLGNRCSGPRPAWKIEINEYFFPYLFDHRLGEHMVFPGSGFVEAGLQVGSQLHQLPISLVDITFQNLLIWQPHQSQHLYTEYHPDSQRYDVWSASEDETISWVKHSSGQIQLNDIPQQQLSLASLRERCGSNFDVSLLYELFERQGLFYGNHFRAIKSLWNLGHQEILAHLVLPFNEDDETEYYIHPVLLDSAFHALMCLENDLTDETYYVPTRIGKIDFYEHAGREIWVYATVHERDSHKIREDLILFNENGQMLCRIEDFVCERFDQIIQHKLALKDNIYHPTWEMEELQSHDGDEEAPFVLFVVTQDTKQVREIIDGFLQSDTKVTTIVNKGLPCWRQDVVSVDLNDEKALAATLQQLQQKRSSICLVHITPFEPAESWSEAYSVLLDQCIYLTHIAKTLEHLDCELKRLVVITCGGVVVDQDDKLINILTPSLNGLSFLIHNEFSSIQTKSIDLPMDIDASIQHTLVREVFAKNKDQDIALRKKGRFTMHLTQDRRALAMERQSGLRERIDPGAVYLITGGVSGFGLELAKWLGSLGAKHLILISRKGLLTPYAQHTTNKLRLHGCKVIVKALDISSRLNVRQLIEEFHTVDLPIKGIFHCAMVLKDLAMNTMNKQHFDDVMQPKIVGTLNLHEETKHLPLEFFVTTSSISSLIGNVGQANYVVANAFLDHFVHYRQREGLPITNLNIGALSDVGVIARSQELKRYMSLLSIKNNPVKQVIDVLEYQLTHNHVHSAILDFDWVKWKKADAKAASSSRFRRMLEAVILQEQVTAEQSKIYAFLESKEGEPLQEIMTAIQSCVASIMQCQLEKIDAREYFNSMGMDSLMMMELRHQLIALFDFEVSLMALLKDGTIRSLSESILTYFEQNCMVA